MKPCVRDKNKRSDEQLVVLSSTGMCIPNPVGGKGIHSFCCPDGRLRHWKVTSPTGNDLRSQGQNQVWNTDFLDPDPGSLLLRGLRKAGRTREVFVPGCAPLPLEVYHLSTDCWPKTHTFLRSPCRISCWDPPHTHTLFFFSISA